MPRVVALSLIAAVIACLASISDGQEEEKKRSPRLPPYFADIVTPSQRKAIYALQERYADQIAELKAQLDELTRQRDTEIEAVLTPLQLKQLQKAREVAAAKRKKPSPK